ncbi:hypothetical protein C8Q76DRAFT_802429 [Earliella scabrosa]|nr:hypothetical protein C8Q76DRAFT_802429 [Earliella scabrosa]
MRDGLRLEETMEGRTTGAALLIPNSRSHTHLTESREAIADEVYAPTGLDSCSLAQDTMTNDASPKAIVTNVNLGEELVDIASATLERYDIENDIAAQIRTEFDKPERHGPT